MQAVLEILKKHPVVYFATIDAGRPRVRPFQFMLEKENRLYFCTATQKDAYQQLQATPQVEFCVATPENTWLRVCGTFAFADDAEIKARILAENPLVKALYQTPDNPVFTVLYLADAAATIADFSGQPPRRFSL